MFSLPPFPRPRSSWLVRGTAAAVALVMIPSTAGAEPSVEELEQSAAAIADELHRLDLQTSQLDEEHNVARLEMTQLEATIADMESSVANARTEVDSTVSAAIDYAVEAYTGGGTGDVDIFSSPDAVTYAGRRTYLETLSTTNHDAVRGLTVARDELAAQERALKEQKEELASKVAKLEADQTALEAVIEERAALAETISGDLEDAVAAEQERIAAANAAAAARAAEASTPTTSPSTSTTSTQRRVATTTLPTNSATSWSAPPTTAVPAPPVSAPSAGLAKAVEVAMAQRGDPYLWAADGPDSFDCSGLVTYSYGAAGYSLPHSSRALFNMTQRLAEGQLQPGDLVFGGSPVHHVGIYIGNGQMVHAPNSGSVVRVDNIYNTSKPVRFGRL